MSLFHRAGTAESLAIEVRGGLGWCQDQRMTKPWMIDELAHAGSEHLDPGFVAGFDCKQGYPDPAGDLAALREHGIGATSTVVDLGAGTGRFALAAAAEMARVVAVDISPAMLATLQERAARAGLPNVECVRAGFLTYEHTGPPADAVLPVMRCISCRTFGRRSP
jgi:SAM-dependent methyltransferase